MSVSIVVGSQWGDEGKAKVIDYLAERSDVIIRFQGGANAGHTVIVDGDKFIFHLVPSGIMYPGKVCVVGNGVVFDAEQFLAEVDELAAKGISVDGRLFISDIAHLVLPYHKAQDHAGESRMGRKKIGTTGRGIGPAYADKVERTGIRVGDLLRRDVFVAKLKANLERRKAIFPAAYGQELDMDLDRLAQQYGAVAERIKPFVTNTAEYVFHALRQEKKILFEGAQGSLLDIDHGTYPFVTSSNTIAGAVCAGSGIGPAAVDNVIGIVKTYTTRVGNGPFPTELNDETGEFIRREGGEFGATTGRPRRCGWFDSVVVRKAVQLNGITHLALTKLDVLNKLDEIKVCTHYELNGTKQDYYPAYLSDSDTLVPVYESLPGWKEDLTGCSKFSQLPDKAVAYVRRLQELCYGVPMLIVSVGPARDQTIEVNPLQQPAAKA
ncbi:MAG: adenylosuccinate synthase [Chitinivibrionales bacterium]|nr:adenylosuccinate synthase [Chitinivibrionales bacterium]MBD3396033.1 adenylosuccinate synthase [Chitinivibrionales bacterium]